ncbi:MAG: hypothetical protein ACJA0T_000490 [Colwellia sp.]|jgi:hypothetical protein
MQNSDAGNFGIFANQVIRLIGDFYNQTMRLFICG